ncbi:IS66 family transposase [Bradyrhizobium cenepequi]|uniref:IS66 family transposase n=1 Tax=Bradyrhizobium cenepequi TaxID=2821403 RepID=UPI001CE2DDB5|nr:transposase [Bradyrhizobium cenepequi]
MSSKITGEVIDALQHCRLKAYFQLHGEQGGVLVSDFYSAYDGLPCLHQRCLIHLMRDMNRAILDNPFDQERGRAGDLGLAWRLLFLGHATQLSHSGDRE